MIAVSSNLPGEPGEWIFLFEFQRVPLIPPVRPGTLNLAKKGPSMQIISREDAQAANRKKYFTGVACHAGHVAQRFASNGGCCTCASQRQQGIRPQLHLEQRMMGFQEVTLIVHHEDVPLLTDMAAGLEAARRAARDEATAALIARTRASVIGGTTDAQT